MTEKVLFGAGCFWGVEATFQQTPGVVATAVGYAGGTTENPTYEQVCSDRSGHAEVVEVEFDPAKISFEKLLGVFWECHDPTQLNRQGPDWGSQYRSGVYCTTPEQLQTALASRDALTAEKRFGKPIATEILPAPTFWKAEDYHQKYLEKRGKIRCH